MKKILALLLAAAMCAAALTGCGGGDKPKETEKPDTKIPEVPGDVFDAGNVQALKPDTKIPEVPGDVFDAGNVQALVPEGWKAFPQKDIIADNGTMDPDVISICKGAEWYIIPDHHPALVDQATFEAAQIKTNRFKLPNKKRHEYPLRGKMFCGCCRHALGKTPNKTSFYFCRHSTRFDSADCTGVKFTVQEIDEAIFETLKKQMELICPDGVLDPAAVSIQKVSDYEQQLSDMMEQKMRLYERYVSGELDAGSYKREKESIDALILRTKNTYAAISAQVKEEQEQHDEQVQRNQIVQEISAADGLTQALADLLIDRVYVYPDRRIEISYKIKDIFADAI